MNSDFEDEKPPAAIKQDAAAISTELPVVVFADDAATLVSSEIPRVRLLQGRVNETWILYAVYSLSLGSGLAAMHFAVGTKEWSAIVVGLAWFLLFVWYWFYGVAYRYRRGLLKYSCVVIILALTAALAYFSIERAGPQQAMVVMGELAARPASDSLLGAAIATMAAAGLLLVHLVFLGRGYRQKR